MANTDKGFPYPLDGDAPDIAGDIEALAKAVDTELDNYATTTDLDGYAELTDLSSYATLANPTFTGVPVAPTAAAGTNTTQIATTAFVNDAVSNVALGDNLSGIAEVVGDSGLLKKVDSDTWELDETEYISEETDPVFLASASYGIASEDIVNWDTAHGWGDHAEAGYAAADHNHDTEYSDIEHNHRLEDLENITNIGGINDGDFLRYNSATTSWSPASMDDIASLSLTELDDVDTTGASTGNALVFNGTSWEPGEASGSASLALDELTDVDATDPADGSILKYTTVDGWSAQTISIPSELDDFSDVDLTTSPTPGQSLVFDGTSWKASSISVSTALSDLTDVDYNPTPTGGQVLQYNGTSNMWEPATVSGTSSNSFVNIASTGETSLSAESSTDTLSIEAGSNISIDLSVIGGAKTVTISSTAAGGEYTAGTGLTLDGSEFSVTANTYQPMDADLTAIAELSGTSGLLKKTSADTWTLDTNTYLTSYTETDPIFTASAAAGITSTNITNWNTSYGWGNHASVGYSKNVQPINPQTASYTIQDSDLGKLITLTSSSGISLTVPSTTIADGSKIDIIQLGAGQVTVAGSGVTVYSNGGKMKLNGQYAAATLIKTGSASWVLVGNTTS